MEGKLEHRNIIQEYTNFNSQVYAPMPRVGVYLDSGSEQYSVKSRFTSTLDGEGGEGRRRRGGGGVMRSGNVHAAWKAWD